MFVQSFVNTHLDFNECLPVYHLFNLRPSTGLIFKLKKYTNKR